MEKSIRNLWINSVNVLTKDRDAEVICPSCGKSNLVCVDLNLPSLERTELHIFCPSCNVETFVLKRREGAEH
jgi:hypothetical protein